MILNSFGCSLISHKTLDFHLHYLGRRTPNSCKVLKPNLYSFKHPGGITLEAALDATA